MCADEPIDGVEMVEWFYVVNGEQRGPVSVAQLRAWVQQGRITPDTLVWREGMEEWVCASAASELAPNGALDSVEKGALPSPWAEGSQVRPWVRLVARSIDVMLFSMVVGLVLGMFYTEAAIRGNLAVPLAVLLGWCFVEPLLLSRWGTTVGKALLRVRVRRVSDGGVLSYREGLERSLHIWARGLAMGLPIVGIIAQFLAYQDLVNRGTTAWDRLGGYRVEHACIGQRRAAIVIGILVCGVLLAVSGMAG
jgi:hypothetical protein